MRLCARIFFFLFFFAACPIHAATPLNYADQIKPILRESCIRCHNPDKTKGGLDLSTYATLMRGSSSGAIVEPGDPDNSTLFLVVTHAEEPNMPPKGEAIPEAEARLIHRWIKEGLLELTGGKAQAAKKSGGDLKLANAPLDPPDGPPPMPENLWPEPRYAASRANSVTALALSPRAPLAAVGGTHQVFLYHTDSLEFLGVLDYPEGVPNDLIFSRNGKLLLCGGGAGGKFGRVVGWDVVSGQRMIEVGDEYDAVLTSDIRSDHRQVALGGVDKLVQIFSTDTGERLYRIKKHTDWVTAVRFSPDGVLLASGDRNGGLVVWEAESGQEFYVLDSHKAAVTRLAWRRDGNVLASASEDGSVRLWNMHNGQQIKSWKAHDPGVLSVAFDQGDKLVTTGRDLEAGVWDGNGKQLARIKGFKDLVLQAGFTHDGKQLVIGDWLGGLHLAQTDTGALARQVAANPPPLAQRMDQHLAGMQDIKKNIEQAALKTGAAQANLAKTGERLQRLKTDKDRVHQELAGLEKQQADTQKALQAADAEFAKAQGDQDRRKNNLQSLQQGIDQMDRELAALQSTARQLEGQYAEQQKAVAAMAQTVPLALAENPLAVAASGKVAEEPPSPIPSVPEEPGQARDALNTLQQEHSNAKANLDKRRAALTQAKQERDQAQEAFKKAQDQLQAGREQRDGLKNKTDTQAQQQKELQNRMAQLEKEIPDTDQSHADMQKQLEQARKTRTDLEAKLTAAETRLVQLKASQLDLLLHETRTRFSAKGEPPPEKMAELIRTLQDAVQQR